MSRPPPLTGDYRPLVRIGDQLRVKAQLVVEALTGRTLFNTGRNSHHWCPPTSDKARCCIFD